MSFEKDDEDINGRFSFSEYFMPDVEIKDFNQTNWNRKPWLKQQINFIGNLDFHKIL